MLRKRLITELTFNDGVLFRTKLFEPDYRYTLNFVDAWSVDELIVLDITRPGEGSRENFDRVVDHMATKCFVPMAAGGGIRTLDEARRLLRLGADKIVINTVALENPLFISEAANLFGAQCVVVSIDARRLPDGTYEVYGRCGQHATGRKPAEWASECERRGAGEILITSIEKDGSLEGYDNELNRQVADAVGLPVVVAGGAGKWHDFVDGFNLGHASAVATTCIYHFTESSIQSAKKYLNGAGVSVRLI